MTQYIYYVDFLILLKHVLLLLEISLLQNKSVLICNLCNFYCNHLNDIDNTCTLLFQKYIVRYQCRNYTVINK